MFETNEGTENGFYIAGWCAVAAVCLAVVIWRLTGIRFFNILPPCMIHTVTGYYCPGCGGTRAVIAILHGDILQSFRYHPLVPYTAVVGIWFMISQTIERLTRRRIKIGLRYREIYIWVALGLILVNFIIKNAALIFWDVDLLKPPFQ